MGKTGPKTLGKYKPKLKSHITDKIFGLWRVVHNITSWRNKQVKQRFPSGNHHTGLLLLYFFSFYEEKCKEKNKNTLTNWQSCMVINGFNMPGWTSLVESSAELSVSVSGHSGEWCQFISPWQRLMPLHLYIAGGKKWIKNCGKKRWRFHTGTRTNKLATN